MPYIQSAQLRDISGSATTTVAFAATVTLGNFILVATRGGDSTDQSPTFSDSRGNAYTTDRKQIITGDRLVVVASAPVQSAGACSVSVQWTNAGPTLWTAIHEYSGIQLASAVDQSVSAEGNSTTPSSGTLTSTVEGLLFGACITGANATTPTVGAGFAFREQVDGTQLRLLTQERVAPAGPYAATLTLGAASTWAMVCVAYKAAAVPGRLDYAYPKVWAQGALATGELA